MNNFVGLRVFPGPFWNYEPSNLLGTITKVSENVADVQWDNYTQNNYAIGKNNYFSLLVWDSGQIGISHKGSCCKGCSKFVIGTKWGCFECSHYLCGKCYRKKYHGHHHFYRIDKENGIGSYVGQRKDIDKIKCRGIFRKSHIKICVTMCGPNSGTIEAFIDKNETYRSAVKVMTSSLNKIKRYNFGYNGEVDIQLDEEKELTSITKDIYPSHLQVLGMHSIFNSKFCDIFKKDLENFVYEEISEKSIFEENDLVYVDCFDEESLREYQHKCGECNENIKKLIGKCGSVRYVKENIVSVYFENIKQMFNFNSKILFNPSDSLTKVIRIGSDTQLTESINKWKKNITEKEIDICWIPDDIIIKKISNKTGIIIIPNLPGSLVGVRFNRYPDAVCMFLPKSACYDIQENETGPELSEFLHLPAMEPDVMEKGYHYISEDNFTGLTDWIFSKENHGNESSLWSHFIKYTIENDNISMFKSLMTLSVESKVQCLFEIISLKYSTSNFVLPNNMMSLIIPELSQKKGDLLLMAAKAGDLFTLATVIEADKKLVDYVDKSSGYSALHFAVENECLDIIRILWKHKCDIYIQEKQNGFTALHLALKHYYIESFCCILELLNENDLQDLKVDLNKDTILHLSASFPDQVHLIKWQNIVKGQKMTIIEDLLNEHEHFMRSCKYKKFFSLKDMPFAVFSLLILIKGKNLFHAWISEINQKSERPEKIFKESIESLNKDISVKEVNNAFKLFYQHLDKESAAYFCEFCHLDYASVVYEPCGHKIHCYHCSFMPYMCAECGKEIVSKRGDNLSTYDEWEKLSQKVKDKTCPMNMKDWFSFIEKTINYLECSICTSRNWNTVLECGHTFCDQCIQQFDTCAICKKKKSTYFTITSSLN